MKKLNLGCGTDTLPGYVNVDSAKLPGVDVVHNLTDFPWPFSDGEADEMILIHVLEHLPNTIRTMEEIWRISAPGAKVMIRVPFWNSSDFITDPTHIRPFNENTFGFFDPRDPNCKKRPYYSKARFFIKKKIYYVRIWGRYLAVRPLVLRFPLEILAEFLCNIIQVIEVELEAIK